MRRSVLVFIAAAFSFVLVSSAVAENFPSSVTGSSDEPYRTPLAGRPYRATLLGHSVEIPACDRTRTLAVTVGASLFDPPVGSSRYSPLASLYWQRRQDGWRGRAIVSVFVNEIDFARGQGPWEFLVHWENDTVPFPSAEVIDGQEIKSSSTTWGSFSGGVGVGYRIPVAPFEVDNDLRLQLLYLPGYLYASRVADTGPDVVLPPDTFTQTVRLRLSYDGLLRNIMELPHSGWAGGFTMDAGRRSRWADHTFGGTVFSGDRTRDFVKFSGYLDAAGGVPGLSERHRLVGSLHGGVAPVEKVDRFSAFRIGGGPAPTETDDLVRPTFPGALFNQFPVTDYLIATAEYRLELLFFLYLHLRGTVAYVNRPFIEARHLNFGKDHGEGFSAALTGGFFWDTEFYLEYAWDAQILRNGSPGSSVMMVWSKSF